MRLLRDRSFGSFILGKVLSSCGIWIQNVTAAVLMYNLTRSTLMVGAVSLMQFAGPLLLSLWAGSLSDRHNRRKVLVGGRVVSASAVGTLAFLTHAFGSEMTPTPILVCVFIMGVGVSISAPAMHALVPALVSEEDLEPALALSSAAPSLARSLGPAIGAGLIVFTDFAVSFMVASAFHWFYVVVLVMLVRPRPVKSAASRGGMFGGLRYLLTDRKAGALVLGIALIGVGADPAITLTPAIAEQQGGGEASVGLLVSAYGTGAVFVSATFTKLRGTFGLRSLGVCGFWVLAASLVVVAASLDLWMSAAGFMLGGVGFMLATVALNVRVQRRVPEDLRGRVMALWALAFLGSRSVAALFNGAVADMASVRTALIGAAVVTVLSSKLASVRYGSAAPPR